MSAAFVVSHSVHLILKILVINSFWSQHSKL